MSSHISKQTWFSPLFNIIRFSHVLQFSSPNVCTTRDESTDDDSTTKKQKREGDSTGSEVETFEEPSFVHHFSLNVESCQETANKYICRRM